MSFSNETALKVIVFLINTTVLQANWWWTTCGQVLEAYWGWWTTITITITCTITIRRRCMRKNSACPKGPATRPTSSGRCTVCRSTRPATRRTTTRRRPDADRWPNRTVRTLDRRFAWSHGFIPGRNNGFFSYFFFFCTSKCTPCFYSYTALTGRFTRARGRGETGDSPPLPSPPKCSLIVKFRIISYCTLYIPVFFFF